MYIIWKSLGYIYSYYEENELKPYRINLLLYNSDGNHFNFVLLTLFRQRCNLHNSSEKHSCCGKTGRELFQQEKRKLHE